MIDLGAIQSRYRAATEGPWVRTDGLLSYDFATIVDANTALVTHVNKQHNTRDANIDFIAHARADIPALVAEVERLQRELHDEQVRRSEWEKMYNQAIASTACSEAENWRVQATIDRLISNIPDACERLREYGHYNLAGQLQRDRDNLVYWQEHGGLVEVSDDRT